jgi:PAT family acetyl-CoA transporter-like MFS transporter 1
MKERGVSYEGLSLFSLVSIPFSLKLLWAPLVDSCYFKSIGRRKTWIVPVQILTGIVMLIAAPYIDVWMGSSDDSVALGATGPQVTYLTIFFLFLYFLMATQDIVVDGWALTMLSRENVGYASVCNSIGQAFGFFLANQGKNIVRFH